MRAPAAAGAKIIVNVHEVLAARLVPQLLLCEKSPDAEAFVIARDTLPVFFKVTVCDALEEPTSCAANVSVLGETLAIALLAVTVSVADVVLLGTG